MRKLWFVKGAGMLVCGLAMLALTVGPAHAADDAVIEQLKARLDALEKQNKDLQKKLESVGPYQPVYQAVPAKDTPEKERINKQVDVYLKEKDDKKKADDAAKAVQKEEAGYEIGSDLGLATRWNPQQGLLFESPNKDIRSHVGFFFQYDTNFFSQSRNLRPASQVGDLQDGTFFRRIRPVWDGNAYNTFEWNVILALEQLQAISSANQAGLINLDEVWAGVYDIPILGRVRAGHMKVPQGLEGNQFSSSRAMTFQENAAYTDAFYNIFGSGICILNSALDNRVTWQGMLYRDDNPRANTGADFGDGAYAGTARTTALLLDEDEDRHLFHVGLSGTWRKAEKADATLGLSGPDIVRLRARPELRDAMGGFGDGSSLPGNSGRMVDTGNIAAPSTGVVGSELLYILGPFSAQAEWAVAYLNNAVTGTGRNLVDRTRSFNGGYVMLSYFLTGETRYYDKTYGRLGTFYINRPFTNFWAHRSEDGGLTWGSGAWEIAARYSYLNLNDGPIQGGVMGGTTIGLNWYLSSNLKVQFEYLTNNRYDKTSGANGTVPGFVDGFGIRTQMQF
jgi:phosphate-selective porin OprO and OprP